MNRDDVIVGEIVYFVDNDPDSGQEQFEDGRLHRGLIVDVLGDTVGFIDDSLDSEPSIVVNQSPDNLYTAEDVLDMIFDKSDESNKSNYHSLMARTALTFLIDQR